MSIDFNELDSFHNDCAELAAFGIGVHHAGIGREDRTATEQLYMKKAIKILLATSVRSMRCVFGMTLIMTR